MGRLLRHRLFLEFRQPLWTGFIFLNPCLILGISFFSWPEPHSFDFIFVLVLYLNLSMWLLLVRFCRDPVGQILPFTIAVSLQISAYYLMLFAYVLGFKFYVYPEVKFIARECHPISFIQDQKKFLVGFCHVTDEPNDNGQFDFSVLYDTSGDAGDDENAKAFNHSKDRREWVDAIRNVTNDNPNEPFETSNFFSLKVYGDFYWIRYDDDGDDNGPEGGFIKEYGHVPYNAKNPYFDDFGMDAEPPK